jgi:hypothetical protein
MAVCASGGIFYGPVGVSKPEKTENLADGLYRVRRADTHTCRQHRAFVTGREPHSNYDVRGCLRMAYPPRLDIPEGGGRMRTILNFICARVMILFLLCLPLFITVSGSVAAEEEKSDTKVSIPWSDFKQILKQLQADTAKAAVPPQLPASYVVAEVAYEGRRYQERVFLFTASMTLSVLEPKHWVEIPLGRGQSLFPDVTVDGKPAATGMHEDGTVFIIVKGQGQHIVRYWFVVDETIASGQSSLSFPMPGQTVARLALLLDRSTYTVFANERALILKSAGRDTYVYEGGLGAGDRAYITWQQGSTLVSGQQALVIGQLNTIYSIGMGVIQVRSQINLNVIHSDIRRFSLTVPAGLDIIDLTGQAVATWE